MSFYSSFSLCATECSGFDESIVIGVCEELGMLDPIQGEDDEHVLSDTCYELFDDREALSENHRFIRPTWLELDNQIRIGDLNGGLWEANGYTISFSGNGYLFPRQPGDFAKILSCGVFADLAERIKTEFGGGFYARLDRKHFLESRLVVSAHDWVWFASES